MSFSRQPLFRAVTYSLLSALLLCTGHTVRAFEEDTRLEKPEQITLFQPYSFNEIWGYLLKGEEKMPSGNEPLTDLCYFSCSVGWNGQLSTVPAPPLIAPGPLRQARLHLVIADLTNAALMRTVLNPAGAPRANLIRNITAAAAHYHGIQIDFEAVPFSERANFAVFLQQLKTSLGPDKTLSVALPARRALINDGYDYKRIGTVVDRVLIMAYDQHWSTSKPGPVASLAWCREVVSYARSMIPNDRLIMWIASDGRVWQVGARSRSVPHRATLAQCFP
jgi:spore germination protein YaaH